MDIDQCIPGCHIIPADQVPHHGDQTGKIRAGKRQMPGPVIQSPDMGIRSEEVAGIIPDHFIQAVAEQKSPVIHRDADILLRHEPPV
jgi:hypothetical protein